MTTSGAKRRSIRTILIHRPMQRLYTLTMIGVMVTAGLAVSMMIQFTLEQITHGAPRMVSRLALEQLVSDANMQLIMGTILIIFVAVIVLGLFGIFFLHRIAGPIYRIRQVLREMASGHVPPDIRLREHDYFHETADELNRVIGLLRRYVDTSRAIHEIVAKNAEQELSSEAKAKIDQLCQSLANR